MSETQLNLALATMNDCQWYMQGLCQDFDLVRRCPCADGGDPLIPSRSEGWTRLFGWDREEQDTDITDEFGNIWFTRPGFRFSCVSGLADFAVVGDSLSCVSAVLRPRRHSDPQRDWQS